MFPDGLSNSSGEVGQNYMRHITGSVYGVFDKPVNMQRGTTMAGIISDESVFDPSRGFYGGYEMETVSLGLPFLAAFLSPGAWGKDYSHLLEMSSHMAGMWLVGEDMPQASNKISLHDSKKDQYGLPVPNVHYDDHANDVAMRKHAYTQGAKIYEAVGAKEIVDVLPYPSTHNLGTCRMSAKAEDGVCNGYGQSHDIDNLFISDGSQFTSSAAENPPLTIVSLAIRQAEYIAKELKQNKL
jgi:choline dehydrogenase-like flavoprotein